MPPDRGAGPAVPVPGGVDAGAHRARRAALGEAIEWLERAAQAPAPTVEALHGLLYELGDILESSGEDARALAVFIELLAAAPGYRDVADRVASLSRRQAGSA